MRCGYGVGILNLKPIVLKSNIKYETTLGSSVISLETLIIHCVDKWILEILSVMKSNLMREILISPDRVGKLKVYPKETNTKRIVIN